MDKLSNEEVIEQIKGLIARVNERFKLDKVILFGSRARDDWLYTSDIYLIFVSEDFKAIHFLDRMSIVARMWDGMLELQLICYTPEEFERKKKQIGTIQTAVKELAIS